MSPSKPRQSQLRPEIDVETGAGSATLRMGIMGSLDALAGGSGIAILVEVRGGAHPDYSAVIHNVQCRKGMDRYIMTHELELRDLRYFEASPNLAISAWPRNGST
jgi:hypothetical protein